MFISQKTNLNVTISFSKITYHFETEIRKMLLRSLYGKRVLPLIMVHDLLAIEIESLFLKLTIVLNSMFNGR